MPLREKIIGFPAWYVDVVFRRPFKWLKDALTYEPPPPY